MKVRFLLMLAAATFSGCQFEQKGEGATPSDFNFHAGYEAEQRPEGGGSSNRTDINDPSKAVENGDSSSNQSNQDASLPSANVNCDAIEGFNEQMVCLHNRSRANATNPTPNPALPPVTWNDDLAQIAANYAAKCIWDHNSERSENFNTYVGENIQVQSWAGNHAINSIKGWVDDEIPFYDYATNSCTPGEQCGHYTQVVWRESVEIGCAMHVCSTMQGFSASPAYFTVCNYAPGGNYNGQKPY